MFGLVTPCSTAGEAGLVAGLPGDPDWGLATVTADTDNVVGTWTGLLAGWLLKGTDTTACWHTQQTQTELIVHFQQPSIHLLKITSCFWYLWNSFSRHWHWHPDLVRGLMYQCGLLTSCRWPQARLSRNDSYLWKRTCRQVTHYTSCVGCNWLWSWWTSLTCGQNSSQLGQRWRGHKKNTGRTRGSRSNRQELIWNCTNESKRMF